MSNLYNPTPAPRPRRRKAVVIVAIVLVALAGLCAVGTIVAGAKQAASLPLRLTSTPSASAVTPHPQTTPKPFTADDVELTVKTTRLECFDTAGANVEWKIKAAAELDVLAAGNRDYEVTYEVRGLEGGANTATLTLHPDGTYDQDSYASGQTRTCHPKLTAVVTDIEAS